MSAAAISPNFFAKRSTDELIRARDLVSDILDFRARQSSLFEPPAAVVVAPTAPAPVAAPVAPAAVEPSQVPEILSPSAVNCFLDCEVKWFYRRVLQLPEARSAALGLGSAVHAALAVNFKEKIHTGDDLPFESVRTVFRAEMGAELEQIELAKDESADDLLDAGDAMVRVYMDEAAPGIQPAAVDVPVEGYIGAVPVRGYIDLLDVEGCIIDLKTAKKKPVSFPAAHRLQVTTYSMLGENVSGRARLDTLTKSKTVALDSRTIDIGDADRKFAEKTYGLVLEQMQTGLVKPSRGSFLCSKKYCGFHARCEAEYGGTVAD